MFEFRSVLCSNGLTDDVDDAALCHALKIALTGKIQLVLGHAEGEQPGPAGECRAALHEVLARWGLLDEGEHVDQIGLDALILRVPGSPEHGLAHLAHERRPDLLVVGTHQRKGVGRWVHPSVAEAMARVTRLPTLFVPGGAAGLVSASTGELRLGRVLVPVATWPDASRAAQLAQRLASTLNVQSIRYRTLHVGKRRDAPTLDRMHDEAIWEHVNHEGALVPTILQQADDFGADLVVMATEGHDSLGDRLLGSTVERVVRESGCPVLSAPPAF